MGKKRLRRELKALERINASLTASNASTWQDIAELRRGLDEVWSIVGVEHGDANPVGVRHLPTVVARRMTELQEWRQGWRTAEPSVFGPMQEQAIVDWDVFGEEGSLRTARTPVVCSGRPWGSDHQHCWNYPYRAQEFAPTPCATMTGCDSWIPSETAWWLRRCQHRTFDIPAHTHPCGGAS